MFIMFSRFTFSRIARVTIAAASLVLLMSRSLSPIRHSAAGAGNAAASAQDAVVSQIQQRRV